MACTSSRGCDWLDQTNPLKVVLRLLMDPRSKVPPNSVSTTIERILNEGRVCVLVTLVEGRANVGAKLLHDSSGEWTGTLGDEALDVAVTRQCMAFLASRDDARTFFVKEFAPELVGSSEVRLLFERIQPERRIVICGAGHVGASLARLASMVGYEVTLIDDRAEFLIPDFFRDENIELVKASDWGDAVRAAIGNGGGVAVAIVTRGHNEDEECLRAVVSTNPDYIGLIGSKRRTNIVLERLRSAGAEESKLKKVHAPIGLDIGAVTPEEVALAILAEVISERRGGKGGSLSAWRHG
jgi:xanthine dehydrogenase accessory factor